MRIALIFCGVALSLGAPQKRDPVFPRDTIWNQDETFSSAKIIDHDFVRWCRVGPYTFILEKTTLPEIIHDLGKGLLKFNGGDAAGGEFMVDYTDGKKLIRFSSNAEMGGDTNDLDEIEIRTLTPAERETALPVLTLPVSFPFGNCEMSFQTLKAKLGPSVVTNGKAAYEYDGKKPGIWYPYVGKNPVKKTVVQMVDYDVWGTLEVDIVAGRIVALSVTHITSY